MCGSLCRSPQLPVTVGFELWETECPCVVGVRPSALEPATASCLGLLRGDRNRGWVGKGLPCEPVFDRLWLIGDYC